MKKALISVVILSISILTCIAQKNLKPGYIIDLKQDTIRGYVDYRNDVFNSEKCVFCDNPESDLKTFLPLDIYAYRIDESRYYVSKHIKSGEAEKVVFLEYLVNGITSLYYLKDDNGERFFVEKGNDLYELTNNVTIIKQGNDQYFKESNLYKGLLRVIYSDSPEIIPKINSARFDRRSMVNLSEKYHNLVCTDRECIIYEKSKKEAQLDFGPIARIEFHHSSYKKFLKPFDSSNSTFIMLGLAANIRLLSINEKMNIGIKALVSKESTSASYSDTLTAFKSKSYLDYEKIGLHTAIDLKYIYPAGKFRPSFGIGPEIGFFFGQKSNYLQQNYNGFDFIPGEKKKDFLHFNFDLAVSGNAGFILDLKKASFFLEMYYKIGAENCREYGTAGNGLGDVSYYSGLSAFGINTGFLF